VGRANAAVFVEVQNAYDHDNFFQYVWNSKTRAYDTLEQIHFLPVAGINVEF
jgi:hypothetical protein